MDYKKRVVGALERYYQRQEKQEETPSRKNNDPEKQLEKKACEWFKLNGFDIDIIEAKATFNPSDMSYTGISASFGMSDCVGNSNRGHAVFIELKAPGRRIGSALREKQRSFLIRKINTGCFAIVADSIEYIDKTWKHFQSLPTMNERISFLLNELPQHKPRQVDFDLESSE